MRAFLTLQTGIFDQKYRRCVNCRQTLDNERGLVCRLYPVAGGDAEHLISHSIGAWAAGYLRHQPPLPEEVEDLIRVVEDELMSRLSWFEGWQNAVLQADWPQVKQIADAGFAVTAGNGRMLSRDQLEHLFNRFARVVNGRPAFSEGIPEDAGFAASLIVLREIMHHWDFATLWIPDGVV